MLNLFANKYVDVLEPLVKDKKNIIKISSLQDCRSRISKDTKVIMLEDRNLIEKLYDILEYMEQRGVSILDFNTQSNDSETLKNYLIN